MRQLRLKTLLTLFIVCGLLSSLAEVSQARDRAKLVFFKVPGCPKCLQVANSLQKLDRFKTELIFKDITQKENQELLAAFEEEFKVAEAQCGVIPKVFAGNSYLVWPEITPSKLQQLLNNSVDNRRVNAVLQGWARPGEFVAKIMARFARFSLLTVGLAGLVDGINPCAMATLVFFLSFLFYAKSSRRQIVLIGISFILGTFIAYLLVGVGFMKTVYALSVFPFFAKALYPFFTLATLALFIISLFDYRKMSQARFREVTLQLPPKIKAVAHRIIRSKYFLKALPVYGFVTGFGIALIEFLCTGQVYLPTIVYIIGIPEARASGLFYLILYNLFFILPLVGTFLVVYLTFSADSIRLFVERHLKLTKLMLAMFFLLITIFMAYQSWLILN